MLRLSFLAVSFWFLIGLSSGWWLHRLYNEHNIRYQPLQPLVAEQAGAQNIDPRNQQNIRNTKTTMAQQERDLLQQWFADNDYDKIFPYYEQLINQGGDTELIERTRHTLLIRIKNMIDEDPNRALLLLQQFKQIDAYDPVVLFLMAEAYLADERYMLAIDTAISLNTFVQDEIGKEQIAMLIDKAEARYSEEIKQTGHFDKMLGLYEKLINSYSDQAVYYYRMAETQKKLNLFEDALASLDYITYDGSWGKQARDLASIIQQLVDLEGGIRVPVEQVGDHYIVSASINGVPGIQLLIDTGSSLCSLRPNVAESLGITVDYDKRVVINLAVGTTSAPIATADLFEVGEARLNNLKINVIEMPVGVAEDGLLGMNFLGRYRWLINQEEKMLYLGAK